MSNGFGSLAWLKRRRREVGIGLSVVLTGLTDIGIYPQSALVGDHAGLGAAMSDLSAISALAWGTSKADVDGAASLGTGAAPSSFTGADTGNPAAPGYLWVRATVAGVNFYASAPIRCALPTISTQAAVSTAGTGLGDTITLTPAVFAGLPAAYTRTLTLYASDETLATGNGSGAITHDITAAEDNELIDGLDVVVCSGGTVTSDATGQFQVADFIAPAITTNPVITAAKIGAAVQFDAAAASGNPTPSLAYEVLVDGVVVGNQTFVLTEAQDGADVQIRVTASSAFGADAVYTTPAATISYNAPTSAGALADLNLVVGVAMTPVNVKSDFTVTGDADLSGLTLALYSGTIPAGLAFDGSILSGTPTGEVTATLAFQGTNSGGSAATGFGITVAAEPAVPNLTAIAITGPGSVGTATLTMPGETAGTPIYVRLAFRETTDDAPTTGDQVAAGTGATATAAFTQNAGDTDQAFTIVGSAMDGLMAVDATVSYDNTNWADPVSTTATFDTLIPTLLSLATSTDGATLTITMSETGGGTENTGDHTVKVGGSPVTISAVSIPGDGTIVLTPAVPFAAGQTITASYVPGDIEDDAGNALAAFTDQPVTNNVVASGWVDVDLQTGTTGEAPSASLTGVAGKKYLIVMYIVQSATGMPIASMTVDPGGANQTVATVRFANNTSGYSVHLAEVTWPATGALNVEADFTIGGRSATASLFRLVEIPAGKVFIDAIEVYTETWSPNTVAGQSVAMFPMKVSGLGTFSNAAGLNALGAEGVLGGAHDCGMGYVNACAGGSPELFDMNFSSGSFNRGCAVRYG